MYLPTTYHLSSARNASAVVAQDDQGKNGKRTDFDGRPAALSGWGDRRPFQSTLGNRAGLSGDQAETAGRRIYPEKQDARDDRSRAMGCAAGLQPFALPDGTDVQAVSRCVPLRNEFHCLQLGHLGVAAWHVTEPSRQLARISERFAGISRSICFTPSAT